MQALLNRPNMTSSNKMTKVAVVFPRNNASSDILYDPILRSNVVPALNTVLNAAAAVTTTAAAPLLLLLSVAAAAVW